VDVALEMSTNSDVRCAHRKIAEHGAFADFDVVERHMRAGRQRAEREACAFTALNQGTSRRR
ncbi:hypothetical protein, partial [Burkholderia cenocepacia]|uniref:hypothetical protein n=1 Tax=Burkholderia cenocepacia TaxID=95486 RepID=UPI001C0E498F